MDGVVALSYDNRINAGEAVFFFVFFLSLLKSRRTAEFRERTDNNLRV